MNLVSSFLFMSIFEVLQNAMSALDTGNYNEIIDPKDVVYFQPEQIHISFGESVEEIVVTWTTLSWNHSFKVAVEYSFTQMDLQVTGYTTQFIDGGDLQRKVYIHRAKLTNLLPKQRYVYHCGSDLGGWSNEFYFNTLPTESDWSPRLAVYGDLGNVNAQSLPRLQQETQKGMYDVFLHVGDFAYDMNDNNGKVGDEFMRQIETIAAYVPYMVCPGNHENAYNFSHYKNRFTMPKSEDNMIYSFNLGPAHFISFSTEFYYNEQFFSIENVKRQYKWLENDLKEATKQENRAKRPWIVIYGHRPMYCSSNDTDDCTRYKSKIRSGLLGSDHRYHFGLEDLFYKYGVDLEIWAHEHNYQRLWPVYNHTVYNGSYEEPYTNPNAPVHIITGSAGCQERVDPFIKQVQTWSAFRSSDYGYSKITIYNKTHLYLEQVSDDKDGEVIDRMRLIKENHGPYTDRFAHNFLHSSTNKEI